MTPDQARRGRPSEIESSIQHLRRQRASAQCTVRPRPLAGTQIAGGRDQCGELVGGRIRKDPLCDAAGGVVEIAWFEVRHSVPGIWPEEPGSTAGGPGWAARAVWR